MFLKCSQQDDHLCFNGCKHKTLWPKSTVKERVYICQQILTHRHWQKLEPELRSRNWLPGLFSTTCLVHFIVASRTTWQGVTLPTIGHTLPHLSLIKTTDQCGGHFLTCKSLFQNDSTLFQAGKTQPAQWLHGKEHLLPNLAIRVLSLEPTLWKERNHSCKLPSAVHRHAHLHMTNAHAHACTQWM